MAYASSMKLVVALLALALIACSDDDAGTSSGPAVGGSAGSGAQGGGGEGAGGQASGNDWSCIGVLPQQTFTPGSAVGNITVVELSDDSPIANMSVRVCVASDSACATPLDEATTDAQGNVTLDVTTAEQRYLDLSGGNVMPAISFNNGPPKGDPFNEQIRVLSFETFMLVENLIGTPGDPTRGHAGVQANDCNGDIGVGVTFALDTGDGNTVVAYFSAAGTPNPMLEETGEDGRAAIANIPVGPSVLTATVAATGQVIGTRSFFVRAQTISYPACVEADPEA
jgi:hypothetical protein